MADVITADGAQAYGNDARTTDLEPLSEFVPRFVERAFWLALVEAAREMFPVPPKTPRALGLVVSEDPLLGLAAAACHARPEVHIPIVGGAHRRLSRLDRLSDAVNLHYELRSFVRECKGLPERNTPSLMLAWDTRDPLGKREAVSESLSGIASLKGGVVCLCDRRKNPYLAADHPDVLLDVSDPVALVAGALWRLALPDLDLRDQDDAEQWLDKLLKMPDLSLESVISGLSTPSHGDFLRHAQRLKTREWPEVAQTFERYAMTPAEDRPRHAISLFLVSHFSTLSPRQFIELGDALVMEAPTSRPARDQSSPPSLLTDQVLADCNVLFATGVLGDRYAFLGSSGGGLDDQKSGGGPGRAEHLRWLFETRAPLLRERCLRSLGDSLVLGSPSWPIARDFIRHEAKALRAAAENDDAELLEERLRRAVYGNAPRRMADAQGETAARREVARRISVFQRALDRVPALLDELAGSSSDDRLLEAVRTLCSPDPTRAALVPDDVLRAGSAWLFWLLYLRYAGRVRLRDFPSLFQTAPAAQPVRAACVRTLYENLHLLEQVGDRRYLNNFDRPDLLVCLASDIAQEWGRITNDTPECARHGLFIETWTHYLRRTLYGSRWAHVADWESLLRPLAPAHATTTPNDLALVRSLLAGEAPFDANWIRKGRLRGRGGDNEDERAASEALANGRALFDLAQLTLDAIVGVSAFGDFEPLAIDVWLFDAMGHRGSELPGYSFGFVQFWWHYVGHPSGIDDDIGTAFAGAADSVFDMFPVVALMVATHTAPRSTSKECEFVFSAELREWLIETPRHADRSPASIVLERVRGCLEFQRSWREAHTQLRLVRADWAAVKAAMDDRTAALSAFARALEPLARTSTPKARSATSPKVMDPSVQAAPASAANLPAAATAQPTASPVAPLPKS